MTTLADKAILSGADNHLLMLEKDMYDSWKSIMELYMMNRQHGRMILESVENGLLIWPTIEKNGVTRPKKYYELSAMEAIQADCDVKTTNIILQGLPPEERECKLYDEFDKFAYKKGETLRDFYLRFSLLLNELNIYNVKLEQFQVNTKILNTLPPEWSKFMTDVKLQGDDPIDAINHMMSFLSAVVTSRDPTTNKQLRNSSNPRKQATINYSRITLQPVQGRQISFASGTSRTYTPRCTKPKRKQDDSWFKDKVLLVKPYHSDCDELNTAKVTLMANLSHYGSDALAEVYNPDNVNNNMTNQAVQAIPSSEQSSVVNHSNTEITSDSNIIPYSQYVTESQQVVVQNLTSSAQQDALILSMIKQLKTQVVNYTKINLDNKSINNTLTAELERFL
ncbi:hypothetical protein Tco_1421980 [Tanacetum coccineum]